MIDTETALARLFAAALCGASPDSSAVRGHDAAALSDSADYHGVLPLVADALWSCLDVPEATRMLLHTRAQEAALTGMLQEAELRRFLTAMEAAALEAVIVKGGHLAYTHYARPELRPRVDTDILIPANERAAFDDVLGALGYTCSSKVSGELVTGQSFYVKRLNGIPVHGLDVHWKLASPIVFAHILSYDELRATSVPLPGLGSVARGASDVHALLIACVHRVAHHADSMRLLWLYDIDRVARGLDAQMWTAFVDLAIDRKVAAVCRRSLERTTEWFRTPVPADVLERLRRIDADIPELTAGYLDVRPQAEALVDDLRTLGSWGERVRLVREHVFPPTDYMRRVYAPRSAVPLPLLYVWRFVRGARKWLSE